MPNYFLVQRAIIFATDKFAGIETEKPTLLHSVRCGFNLMDKGFGQNVVIAGILHDVLEDTATIRAEIAQQFGENVAEIVSNNTKDPTIADHNQRREELIKRCCQSSYESVIVKMADIVDNYNYYKATNNQELINYCLELKSYMLKYLPDKLNTEYIQSQLNLIK